MKSRRKGVVLLAVLVVVVLLSLAAYRYSEMMAAEYVAGESAFRATQARAFATSGIHYAAAMLSDPDTFKNQLNGNYYDNSSIFRGIAVGPGDHPRAQGRFSLLAGPSIDDAINGSTTTRFGVSDEGGKININALVALDPTGKIAHDVLIKLPNMTEEIADAIIDWIDADDDPRPNGAENQYYSGLSPSYRCKNGPLDTLEELLLVRGVTPDLLFGTDKNRNGQPDANEDQSSNGFDPGWAAYLTVHSRELNRDVDNQPRIYLNDSDVNGLYDKLSAALGEEMATWLIAYRLYGPQGTTGGSSNSSSTPGGQLTKNQLDFSKRPQSISSIFSLIDATVAIPQQTSGGGTGGGGGQLSMTASVTGQAGPRGTTTTVTTVTGPTSGGTTSNSGSNSNSGTSRGTGTGASGGTGAGGATNKTTEKTYACPMKDPSKRNQLLPLLLDKTTTSKNAELPPRVNVNTAPKAVLATLPGLEDSDVQAIIDARPTPGNVDPNDPSFQTPAWLVTQANLSTSKVRALERYITARSQTYRVQSLGYFDQGGTVSRVEAVIDTNAGQPRIIYFRELTELGRGFDIPR